MDRLTPVVFSDAWGSRVSIASLQGRDIPSPEPESELWMGAHEGGASGTDRPGNPDLAAVIAADAATAEAFATAAMMLPGAEAMAMLERVQLAGLAVDDQGCVFETSTLKDFAA